MARAGLTADRVTEAAADLADAVGLENVTVSAVARSFGVKDASLYSHVRNLRDLTERIALLAASEFADRIGAAVAGRAGREALFAFADAYRTYALEHPGRYAATQSRLDPEVLLDSPGHARMDDISYATLRGYRLAEPDLTDAVRLVRSTLHGFASIEDLGGFQHDREITVSWQRILESLHSMLTHWQPEDQAGQNVRR
jgi:AcrR family transcriptional regulator